MKKNRGGMKPTRGKGKKKKKTGGMRFHLGWGVGLWQGPYKCGRVKVGVNVHEGSREIRKKTSEWGLRGPHNGLTSKTG